MTRTWLSVFTAVVLVGVSLVLMLSRKVVLGQEIDGAPGGSTWQVFFEVDGETTANNASLTMLLPPDFRRQHIVNEQFESKQLTHTVRKAKGTRSRSAVWRPRPTGGNPGPFRLVYSIRYVIEMRRPTSGMINRTRTLDAPPHDGVAVKPSPFIESDHEAIAQLARELRARQASTESQVMAFYDYVRQLDDEASDESPTSALTCLQQKAGDAAAKSRLLIALCRSQRIPGRMLRGLILTQDGPQNLHTWAEVWTGDHWLPVCPSFEHFGNRRFPENYLVLYLGEEEIARGEQVHFSQTFQARNLHNQQGEEGAGDPSLGKLIWRRLTFTNLRPEEQEWVKFLLLLPIGALVVSISRTVIGINTFGTFGPALLGLVGRDLKEFPWVLLAFTSIMLVGWCIRRILDRYHLLLVPRISILLTAIVLILALTIVLLSPAGAFTGSFIGFLPLIIMTHMVERFWTVEVEDSAAASFKTFVGTIAVASTICLIVNSDVWINGAARFVGLKPLLPKEALRTTLFRYPEALGFVLAAQFLIGRYTGYRLTELVRFRDLLLETTLGESDVLASTAESAQDAGHSGHERPQYPVHPRP